MYMEASPCTCNDDGGSEEGGRERERKGGANKKGCFFTHHMHYIICTCTTCTCLQAVHTVYLEICVHVFLPVIL